MVQEKDKLVSANAIAEAASKCFTGITSITIKQVVSDICSKQPTLGEMVALSSLKQDDNFFLGNLLFTVVKQICQDGQHLTFVIAASSVADLPLSQDNTTNNWKDMKVRKVLNGPWLDKFAQSHPNLSDAIVPFERNLISYEDDDESFGVCEDKVSILTAKEYTNYFGYISRYPMWLLTPWKCDRSELNRNMAVLATSAVGAIDSDYLLGIHPFLCLKSDLLVVMPNMHNRETGLGQELKNLFNNA